MTTADDIQQIQDSLRDSSPISREEFESFIAEVESFRDTILDEFAKIRQDLEKLKYNVELVEEILKEKDMKLSSGQKRLS
ncbi:TPA: hypothetical protein HA246_00190 [Candidatus Woesearchaeota archaeon]|nr:hypothetical protein [Candidatus Woesearchaeota archaeon]